MGHPYTWLFVVGVIAGITACTTPQFTMPPGPPDYRIGFHDGCDAGYTYAGSPFYGAADWTPPAAAPGYMAGWQAGFDKCRASYQRVQKMVSLLLGPL
jgi:hypothetical protein